MKAKQVGIGSPTKEIEKAIREARNLMYSPPRSGPQALKNLIGALGPLLRLHRYAQEDRRFELILTRHVKEGRARKTASAFTGLVRLAFPDEDKHFLSHLAGFLSFAEFHGWRANKLAFRYSFEVMRRRDKEAERNKNKKSKQKTKATYDAISKEGRKLAVAGKKTRLKKLLPKKRMIDLSAGLR